MMGRREFLEIAMGLLVAPAAIKHVEPVVIPKAKFHFYYLDDPVNSRGEPVDFEAWTVLESRHTTVPDTQHDGG